MAAGILSRSTETVWHVAVQKCVVHYGIVILSLTSGLIAQVAAQSEMALSARAGRP